MPSKWLHTATQCLAIWTVDLVDKECGSICLAQAALTHTGHADIWSDPGFAFAVLKREVCATTREARALYTGDSALPFVPDLSSNTRRWDRPRNEELARRGDV